MVEQKSDGITGRCLCGAIRYRLAHPHKLFVSCQCRDCRYVSGGAPASVLVVSTADLELTGGVDQLRSYVVLADSGRQVARQFCIDCGTPMFEVLELDPDIRLVKAGTLDDQANLRVDATVWASSAPGWSATLESGDRFDHHFPDDYAGRSSQ